MIGKIIRPIEGSSICSVIYSDGEEEFGARYDLDKSIFLDDFPEEYQRQATLFILTQLNYPVEYIEAWKKENPDPLTRTF